MKNLLFVVNPVSGKAHIRNEFLNVVDSFVKNGYEVTVHTTQGKNDARDIVYKKVKDFDVLVCSGGDGTLNEVVTGLILSGENKPLGYIPAGTTNDFAQSIGISRDIEKACNSIINTNIFSCDIGKFNDAFFTYVAAFGLFTNVSYSTPQENKNILGQLAYVLEGVKCLTDIKSYHLKITHNNILIEDDFIFGIISNSNSIGGFKKLHPIKALLNDGLFEVLLVRKPSKISDFSILMRDLLASEPKSEYIYRFLTSDMEIFTSDSINWTIDGECYGECSNVSIKNLKEVVNLFV